MKTTHCHRGTAGTGGRTAGAVLLLLTAAVLAACTAPPPGSGIEVATPAGSAVPTDPPELPRVVMPDGSRLVLELATTQEEISNGLMFRPSLPPDRGMLFLFQQQRRPSFWMKHTMIPLDILFLDEAGGVVDLALDAQPCATDPCPRYVPSRPVWAVLEIAAGGAARHGVEPGSKLRFERVPGYPIGDG